MAKYILFDTDTTGNQEEDRIIQVGAMIVDSKGKVEVCDEDMGYINWMMDKMDLDVGMKYTLDKIMGRI